MLVERHIYSSNGNEFCIKIFRIHEGTHLKLKFEAKKQSVIIDQPLFVNYLAGMEEIENQSNIFYSYCQKCVWAQ